MRICQGTPMTANLGLQQLLAWTSPAYPIGAYTYSHGLEAAVESGAVTTPQTLHDYVFAALSGGGIWVDAALFAHAWRAWDDPDTLDDIASLAAAFRATSETSLESHQQGKSFLSITRKAWPHPALDAFAAQRGQRPIAHCVALAVACGCHGVALKDALEAFLHGAAANLVSAGVRLIPLGQSDGQITTAKLSAQCAAIADKAMATHIDEIGASAVQVDMACLSHETQYTRLFRS